MNTASQLEFRMREPVARALIRRLMVPKIYFEAPWPDASSRQDIVAVDRAGTGDVHVVELKDSMRSAVAYATVNRLIGVPANYLWLAFPSPRAPRSYSSIESLYPQEGAGRVGLIEVVVMAGNTFGANIVFPAERFHDQVHDLARSFVRNVRPDITYR